MTYHRWMSIALVLLWTAESAARGKPELCNGSRFLVTGTLLMSADRSAPTEAIVLQDGDASLGNACPPMRARTKALRGRILMRAIWPACAGVAGPVGPIRLRAWIDARCVSLHGQLGIRRSVTWSFIARQSTCGDGVFDPGGGEECDQNRGCDSRSTCVLCRCVGSGGPSLGTPSTTLPSGEPTTTSLTTTTTTTMVIGVSFSGQVQPIFTANCALSGCHVPPGQLHLALSPGAAYASLVGVPSVQCQQFERVAPGDPDASYLIDKLLDRVSVASCFDGTGMPPGRRLSDADLGVITQWIVEGAKDN